MRDVGRYLVEEVAPSRVRPGCLRREGDCTALGQPVTQLASLPRERFPSSQSQPVLPLAHPPYPAENIPAPQQSLVGTGGCCGAPTPSCPS